MVNALNIRDVSAIPEQGFWESFAVEAKTSAFGDPGCRLLVGPSNAEHSFSQDTTIDKRSDCPSSSFAQLFKLHKRIESSTQLNHLASRILMLLIHYHHKQIRCYVKERNAKDQELLRITGISLNEFDQIKAKAQGWLRVIDAFGIGVLAIANANANDEYVAKDWVPSRRGAQD